MNPYIEKLKDYLSGRPVNSHREDAQSILELLCYIYVVDNSVDNSVIAYQFREVNQLLKKFTLEENTRFFCLVSQLCTEYMRQAFLSGFHVGFQLDAELRES